MYQHRLDGRHLPRRATHECERRVRKQPPEVAVRPRRVQALATHPKAWCVTVVLHVLPVGRHLDCQVPQVKPGSGGDHCPHGASAFLSTATACVPPCVLRIMDMERTKTTPNFAASA